MSGSILPSRVSTTFTFVKTSVCADGSACAFAQMHGFKQRKASKNARIPQPREQAEKQLGKLMGEQRPSQLISGARLLLPMVNGTFVQCGQDRHSHTQIRGNAHSWFHVPRSQWRAGVCTAKSPIRILDRSQTVGKCRCNFFGLAR